MYKVLMFKASLQCALECSSLWEYASEYWRQDPQSPGKSGKQTTSVCLPKNISDSDKSHEEKRYWEGELLQGDNSVSHFIWSIQSIHGVSSTSFRQNSQVNTEKEMLQRGPSSTRYLKILKSPYNQNDVIFMHEQTDQWNRTKSL